MAATTTNSNTNTSTIAADHSPRHSSVAAITTLTESNHPVSSPQSRRAARSVSSPWTQIVRGESESMAATSSSPPAAAIEQAAISDPPLMMAEEESLENEGGSVSNAGKRPAWNKPSNGVVESGPVMGAVSWPALSESARASNKSSSDSLKSLSDGSSSVSIPQGTAAGTGTIAAAASSSSHKQVGNSATATPNHTIPTRQRSMKRNGASNSSNGGISQPPGSQGPGGEVHLNNSSIGDHGQRSSQSRGSDDHPQQPQRNFRNRNGGPHSRGDGSHQYGYGGRRDQDRPTQDWNPYRNFNGRDGHMQSQRPVSRFMRHPPPPPPPPSSTPFVAPPLVRPFGGPMGFHEIPPPVYYVTAPPPESLRGVPYVTQPIPHHAVFLPVPDLQLHSRIVNQIDYYFSNENLIKDTFLRQNMDEQGWVPIKLIAGFNKVSHLTDSIQLILDAVRNSTIVEVQGDKVRRRNDWMRWIMPTSVQFPNVSGPQSLAQSSHDMLAARVQGMSLEEKAASHSNARSQADVQNEASLGRSSSGDLNSHSQLSSAEGVGEVSVQGALDRSTSARNYSK